MTLDKEQKFAEALCQTISLSPKIFKRRDELFEEFKKNYPEVADEDLFYGAITPEFFERIKYPEAYIDEKGTLYK